MKPKTIKILYWTLTLVFSLFMVMDGLGGVTRAKAGQEALSHLGYPMYVLSIFGVAKLLGALALVQTKFQTIKEWAYAGFAINFIGAFASRALVGDEIGLLIPPIVALAFMFATYFIWKKFEQLPEKKSIQWKLIKPKIQSVG